MTSQDIYLAAAETRDAIAQAAADITKQLEAIDESIQLVSSEIADLSTEIYKLRTRKPEDAT